MAQYITTLTQGKAVWHLSTNGRDIFHSRHYLTGGVIFPELVCRDGRIVERVNLKAISEAEMIGLLSPIPETPVPMTWFWHCLGSFAGLFRPCRPTGLVRFLEK
jgi:hypothetical protein